MLNKTNEFSLFCCCWFCWVNYAVAERKFAACQITWLSARIADKVHVCGQRVLSTGAKIIDKLRKELLLKWVFFILSTIIHVQLNPHETTNSAYLESLFWHSLIHLMLIVISFPQLCNNRCIHTNKQRNYGKYGKSHKQYLLVIQLLGFKKYVCYSASASRPTSHW